MKQGRITRGLLVLAILSALGCAPAYHWYQSCVPCRYSTPCPLPYQAYCESGCHSRAAEPYLNTTPIQMPWSTLPDSGGATEGE